MRKKLGTLPDYEEALRVEQAFQSCLLHAASFGLLPFRAVSLDPTYLTWNNGTIPMLAQAVYNNHAFDRLPLLANALEVIGCTNADVLSHLRAEGPHVKGCWALDLLIGK